MANPYYNQCMVEFSGISSSPGYAIGKAFIYRHDKLVISHDFISSDEVDAEIARLEECFYSLIKEFRTYLENAIGDSEKALYTVELLMLEDVEYHKSIKTLIQNKRYSAPWAVEEATEEIIKMISGVEDEYLKERIIDIRDIEYAVLETLTGKRREHIEVKERFPRGRLSQPHSPEIVRFPGVCVQLVIIGIFDQIAGNGNLEDGKEQDKKEIQEGLIKACDVIDLIIEILRGSQSVKDAKECLTKGVTENIKFKSGISKKMAAMLRFTERQATAILEMRLYRLIGLEIEALMQEHEETLKNIARYEDILNNYDSMAEVIVEDLDKIKAEYGRKRRTVIENGEEAVYEEHKIEEQDVIFLMDRFGYARTIDVSTYERNKDAADTENKVVIACKNTGKICLFTNTGKMHQIKVLDLPFGKFRDKGVPVDNVSNFDSTGEDAVYLCDAEQMRYAKLLFATRQGMIKKVEGTEFQVAKRTIAATKLQAGDEVVTVQVITDNQNVVLQTREGYFLRFAADEVSEKKKGAIGVRGIRLKKKDELEHAYLFEEGTETKVTYGEKEVSLNRLKMAKRDGNGTKTRG